MNNEVKDQETAWKRHAYPLQQITVLVQGTRHSGRDDLAHQLELIAARLRRGESRGEEHDDDFGYRFAVTAAPDGPSFFEAPSGQG